MDFVALVSGGKDSFYNTLHCVANGHRLVALANLHPPPATDELDSHMFQTVGHDVVPLYAECCAVPLYRRELAGGLVNLELDYTTTVDDEIEDLYALLSEVQRAHPSVKAVGVGAILLLYQRTRVEHVCGRLGLTVLAYLWQRDQGELMAEMCSSAMEAILIKVAAVGLDARHLGMTLRQVHPTLVRLNSMYEVHVCGEGGEFELLVLDAPCFQKRLVVVDKKAVEESQVAYLQVKAEVQPRGEPVAVEDWVAIPPVLRGEFVEIESEAGVAQESAEAVAAVVETLPSPALPPLSVKSTPSHIFVSNVTPADVSLLPADQMRDVLSQVAALVPLTSLQLVLLLVADMADFALLNAAYRPFFPDPLPPSRVCVSTTLPAGAVRLSCVALRQPRRTGLHVQGISYWAPCNIGPYSQSIVDADGYALVAGQIPLVPASMELHLHTSPADVRRSVVLALQHWCAVKDAVRCPDVVFTVVYVTAPHTVPAVLLVWGAYSESVEFCGKRHFAVVQVELLPRGATVEWCGMAFGGETHTAEYGIAWEPHADAWQLYGGSCTAGDYIPVRAVWDASGQQHGQAVVTRRAVA